MVGWLEKEEEDDDDEFGKIIANWIMMLFVNSN